MRVNPSGFFMAALRADGSKETIRTLEQKDAIAFFDDKVKDDDEFVMHARIPSRGAKSLDNVHGWESDGIYFMHNMTISTIDSMMTRVKWGGTDSEFFFRKIFIPYYRGLKDEAYKDGKFHEDLDNLITFFVGVSNKFCFIMPDNKVIRYGNWVQEPDRKENGEVAFFASNSGYKVVTHCTAQKGGSAANTAGFPGGYDPYDFSGYDYGYGYRFGCTQGHKSSRRYWNQGGRKTSTGKAAEFSGQVLLKLAGVKGVCELALTHLVIESVASCRSIYSESKEEDAATEALREMFPKCFCPNAYKELTSAIAELVEANEYGMSAAAVEQYVSDFVDKIAPVYEEYIVREKAEYAVVASEWTVNGGLEATNKKIAILKRLMNITINTSATDPESLAKAFVLSEHRDLDEPAMLEIDTADIIGIDDLRQDDAPDAVQMLLCAINDTFDDYYIEDGDVEDDTDEEAARAYSKGVIPEEVATLSDAAETMDSEMEMFIKAKEAERKKAEAEAAKVNASTDSETTVEFEGGD